MPTLNHNPTLLVFALQTTYEIKKKLENCLLNRDVDDNTIIWRRAIILCFIFFLATAQYRKNTQNH